MSPDPGVLGGEHVTAVVVTYERRELLDEALTALGAQTRTPNRVIVVDNASADGTTEMVTARFPNVDLLTLPRNIGGAGGFSAGMARALDGDADSDADASERDADLLWLLDDDTVPEPGALEALLAARKQATTSADGPPALVAGRVVWTDGRDHPMNTPRPKPRPTPVESRIARAAGCVPIRSASFVSVLVDAAVVRECGLPVADYFLWNDDFEFTTRLLRGRRGLLCPASVAVHKTERFGGADADPGERFFYEVRNKIWLFSRSSGLAPAERVLYTGSTLRRWARTFAGSSNRARLGRAMLRGIRAGLFGRPRPTAALLREVGVDVPVPAVVPGGSTTRTEDPA
ncbi:GT2 family glycosyltransferase [Actinomadura pelletieri DSM 43383]|uniref:GT2 family glycosyltransferase n=1 Tax=Actinomadura pelletieri DSM 43383 TaxID=1120940 RepID=A0A495QGU8_9ACTN|nr:glycosyltransferase [Actinomadura pelletieri]RKS71137.1 GT2 family glycosyltransferase [Actinomadura pelletieri DSM 43383]